MTTTRALTLALAFAAVLTFTGCPGKNCSDATPPIKQVPSACTAVAGQPLTVPVNTCPKCDQAVPTCDVRAVTGGGTTSFTLEPVSEVCDPQSCAIPGPSCAAVPTNCVITATMLAGLDTGATYDLNIVMEAGSVARQFTFGSGTPGCGAMGTP